MVISYFPHSMCIYYLELLCRKDLFLLLHLFNHLFISLWAHGYCFIVWVIIQYSCYLFCCSNHPSLALRRCFGLAPVSFWHGPAFKEKIIFLLSGTVGYSRFILYFLCPAFKSDLQGDSNQVPLQLSLNTCDLSIDWFLLSANKHHFSLTEFFFKQHFC